MRNEFENITAMPEYEDTGVQTMSESLGYDRVTDLSQRWSFGQMALCLQGDLRSRDFDKVVWLTNPKKRGSHTPLAKSVAEDRLSKLGLSSHVVLILLDEEEVAENANKNVKLSPAELEARRAVSGYQWKEAGGDKGIPADKADETIAK